MRDPKGTLYVHVWVNCSALLRGEKLVAVAITAKGLKDILHHVANSDDLYHTQLWRVPPTDKPLAEVAKRLKDETIADERYLTYCRYLAEEREHVKNQNYIRTVYLPDLRGRIDDEW